MIAYILYNPKNAQRTINANRLAMFCEGFLQIEAILFPCVDAPQNLINKYPEMKAGSISCTLSTMQIYTDFLLTGHTELLYFQDDVTAPININAKQILHHQGSLGDYELGYICQLGETIDFLKEHDGNIISETEYSYKLDHGNWVNDALIIDRDAVALTIKSYMENFRVIDCHTRNPIAGITYYRSKQPIFKPAWFPTTI